MGDLITPSNSSIHSGFMKLKNLGQLQLSHMWVIKFEGNIENVDLNMTSYVSRTFSLPGLTRQKIKMRFNDREYTVPGGQSSEHEFSIEMVNDEAGTVFSNIRKWYEAIPKIVSTGAEGLANAKINAKFYLLSMDGSTIRKSYMITGIYPMDVPALDGWNQDSDSEHSKFTVKFAFDDVDYKHKDTITSVSSLFQ